MVNSKENSNRGYISGINGSLIAIKGIENQTRLYDLIKITNHNILGEVIQIYKDYLVVQCYESTMNLKLKEEVVSLKEPLSMELAPGLLAHVFDGIQRPLENTFLRFKDGKLNRGFEYDSLSRGKKWHFVPQKKLNEKISSGDIVGTVQETSIIEHKILSPPNAYGTLSYIAKEGEFTIIDEIYRLKHDGKEHSFCMLQKWPVNKQRPFKKRISPTEPLLTGIRAIDLVFPIAKGGTIGIPGGFGTGKTVIQECIAMYCNADIIVYVECGEPGNEVAHILEQFSKNVDYKHKRPLIERVVLITNTSNMPVSAREASLFSGVTIAEYYRDMGYNVAVLADSTSRWAESLREISSLLEEMPAEEAFPAYLPSKISSFYERAGVVETLGKSLSDIERKGSLTIIGTISPPAGNFNEPVIASTKRVVQGILALDPRLAYLKYYPAIDWLNSYSNYPEYILKWWRERDIKFIGIDLDWYECRNQVNEILSKENDFKQFTQLIGEDELLETQKLELFIAKLIRNSFLIQNAYSEIDKFTGYKKLLALIKLILLIYKEGKELLKKGYIFTENRSNEVIKKVLKINNSIPNEEFDQIEKLKKKFLTDSLKILFPGQKKGSSSEKILT
ncbi:MAG: V-type ATP synthase subunit A [Promethearchaeota archaeon]